ncbi:MAG: protein TolR [Magnetococcales bacterium]|nr:protein TolR [Magnetococcales bacterium]
MAGSLIPQGRRARSFHRPIMSDINVVPFIDIMLVLLVVFMVTAPMMTQGVQVSLPEVESTPIPEEHEPMQVSIKKNGTLFVHEKEIALDKLADTLLAIRQQKPGTAILLRADKAVNYGRVMEVMSALQVAGLVDVGLVTEPARRR